MKNGIDGVFVGNYRRNLLIDFLFVIIVKIFFPSINFTDDTFTNKFLIIGNFNLLIDFEHY